MDAATTQNPTQHMAQGQILDRQDNIGLDVSFCKIRCGKRSHVKIVTSEKADAMMDKKLHLGSCSTGVTAVV
jgi:hypothetical protein